MTITLAALPTLVLLNGITRQAETWSPFRDLFPDRAALAFDGIGFDTGWAADASVPEQARRLAQRMDVEGVQRADIIGFSHGGLVAQQLAFAYPSRVNRLVLLSTSCGVGATAPELPWAVNPGPRTGGADDRAYGAAAAQLIANATWSSLPFLGGITAPTLVVHGRRDRLVPVANARVLARRIPGATLVELPVGHDLQRPDRVGTVARLIADFLATAPSAMTVGES